MRVQYHVNTSKIQLLHEALNMKLKNKSLSLVILALLVFITMLAANPAKDLLVRFTVDNRTGQIAYITLSGAARSYYLSNPSDETSVWTVSRAEYDYGIYACGVWTYGSIDLNAAKTLVIPACGTKAWSNGQGENAIDHGQLINLTAFSLVNETTTHNLWVAVYGNGVSYVFKLVGDTPLHITLPRGEFHYTAYGCGASWTGTFSVDYPGAKKVFKCP
jgi:hypothetical protein